ncbi:MAG: indolepyruvate oxidoreductase subunit beta [Spirochaetales bacterium]|nr:indolepyruvate oxidoreductase subunit beta [Spirochaetales bacterium]
MKYDIILGGVGGQGILSVAAVIAQAAMASGLEVRQSEVHGMAQRGGAVQAHLRLADGPIHGDLIGLGRADMILSMEPLEALRYVDYLKPEGLVVSAEEPYNNIVDYPDEAMVLGAVAALPHGIIVQTKQLAREAGNPTAANMVLVGAASKYLPIELPRIRDAVKARLASKGEAVVEMNLKALELGRGEK